jgi:hypothetical protein
MERNVNSSKQYKLLTQELFHLFTNLHEQLVRNSELQNPTGPSESSESVGSPFLERLKLDLEYGVGSGTGFVGAHEFRELLDLTAMPIRVAHPLAHKSKHASFILPDSCLLPVEFDPVK